MIMCTHERIILYFHTTRQAWMHMDSSMLNTYMMRLYLRHGFWKLKILIFNALPFENASAPCKISLVAGDNHLLKTCFIRDSLGSRSFATCYGIKMVFGPPMWGRWWMYGWKTNVLCETWMSQTLNPESLSPEGCKLWHWYCSTLKVCTQFQKTYTTKV